MFILALVNLVVFEVVLALILKGASFYGVCSFHQVVTEKSVARFNHAGMLRKVCLRILPARVVVSGLFDMVGECCKKSELHMHTVEYSLGIWGDTSCLPEEHILEINTMCSHGMVSVGRIRDITDKIKKGKMTCEEGSKELAKTCTCGIFNWKCAAEILAEIVG